MTFQWTTDLSLSLSGSLPLIYLTGDYRPLWSGNQPLPLHAAQIKRKFAQLLNRNRDASGESGFRSADALGGGY